MPVTGSDELKRTNEIGMAIPLLAHCEIAGRDITADALLTQRTLAAHLVARQAHYHFTVKGNQPTLERDIARHFVRRDVAPAFAEPAMLAHMMRMLATRSRIVFDYLRMTANSLGSAGAAPQ